MRAALTCTRGVNDDRVAGRSPCVRSVGDTSKRSTPKNPEPSPGVFFHAANASAPGAFVAADAEAGGGIFKCFFFGGEQFFIPILLELDRSCNCRLCDPHPAARSRRGSCIYPLFFFFSSRNHIFHPASSAKVCVRADGPDPRY